jgi:integrase
VSDEISIGRLHGRFVVTWRDAAGRRRRFRLAADDPADARREGLDAWRAAQAAAPGGLTVRQVWDAYRAEHAGRSIAATMGWEWRALAERFGALRPDQISVGMCREHAAARRAAGIADGTIWTELGHLRIALSWAQRRRLIDHAPHIERPPKPAPKDRWLTHAEIARLLAAPTTPHIRLAIVLMLGTAARIGALLALRWSRVDMQAGWIDLRADDAGPRKGRAVVPMNGMVRAALETARQAALTDHVIEWGGRPVASIKTGFRAACAAAGLADVSPHVLRHTAAVHMAAAGVPMAKIAQFLGHSSTAITERVYARFAPGHLQDAAAAVDFGGPTEVRRTRKHSAPEG